MTEIATVIVYGLATLVGLYALIFIVPVIWFLSFDWLKQNVGPKRGPHVIDLDERRRRQLERIVNPQRRAQ